MKRASTQYMNMAATVVFTNVLGALLYIITDDQSLRLHLLLVIGGLGLIVAVVFGIRGAWYSLEDRADATPPLRLKSIKGLIIMACVTGYFGLQTVRRPEGRHSGESECCNSSRSGNARHLRNRKVLNLPQNIFS